MGKLRKYTKRLLLLYAAGYIWNRIKSTVWRKGKEKAKKEKGQS